MVLTTSYSGIGTAEFCAQRVAAAISSGSAEPEATSSDVDAQHGSGLPSGLICHSSCDCDEVCQEILLEAAAAGAEATHVFGNILDRLTPSVQAELLNLQAEALADDGITEDEYVKSLKLALTKMQFRFQAPCLRHGGECALSPRRDPKLLKKYGAARFGADEMD